MPDVLKIVQIDVKCFANLLTCFPPSFIHKYFIFHFYCFCVHFYCFCAHFPFFFRRENSVTTLDSVQAMCLPLGASVSLLIMFFFFDSMQVSLINSLK